MTTTIMLIYFQEVFWIRFCDSLDVAEMSKYDILLELEDFTHDRICDILLRDLVHMKRKAFKTITFIFYNPYMSWWRCISRMQFSKWSLNQISFNDVAFIYQLRSAVSLVRFWFEVVSGFKSIFSVLIRPGKCWDIPGLISNQLSLMWLLTLIWYNF